MSSIDSDLPTRVPQADASSSKMVEAIANCPQAIKDLSEALLPTLVEQFSGRSRRLDSPSNEDGGHQLWGSNRSVANNEYDNGSESDVVRSKKGTGRSGISSGMRPMMKPGNQAYQNWTWALASE